MKNSLIKKKYQLKKNLILLFVNNKNLIKQIKKFDKNKKKKLLLNRLKIYVNY